MQETKQCGFHKDWYFVRVLVRYGKIKSRGELVTTTCIAFEINLPNKIIFSRCHPREKTARERGVLLGSDWELLLNARSKKRSLVTE